MKMKKKRFVIWILIALLFVLVVSACQPAAEEPAAEEPLVEEPAAEEPVEEVEEVKEPLKVAFVFGGPVNDYSWNQVWDEGRQSLEAHFGDQIETSYVDNVPWSEESTQVMEQLIADGAEVIVETSGYGDFYYAVSEAHPEVTFLSINDTMVDNEMKYEPDLLTGHYLMGMASGLMSKVGKIGYVASFPAPWNNIWMNAIVLGIRSVNPEATFHVAYVGSYYDPPAVRQASESLADLGVDVLMSYPNVDICMEVAESRGLWTFGRYHPMGDFAPEKYVTTILLDSAEFFIKEFQAILDGTWVGNERRVVSLGEGISIGEWGSNIPQEVIDQVEAMYDRMVNEGYNPLVGPIYDVDGNLVVAEGEEITTWNAPHGVDYLVEGIISTE
jgi:simple sugar transport system substrate-binding protein